jgi:hypothetical protein
MNVTTFVGDLMAGKLNEFVRGCSMAYNAHDPKGWLDVCQALINELNDAMVTFCENENLPIRLAVVEMDKYNVAEYLAYVANGRAFNDLDYSELANELYLNSPYSPQAEVESILEHNLTTNIVRANRINTVDSRIAELQAELAELQSERESLAK